ncbi:MAG: TonB-dependent receptor [Betaproteobacteria bacterium]
MTRFIAAMALAMALTAHAQDVRDELQQLKGRIAELEKRSPRAESAFNPGISLVLQGRYVHQEEEIAERHITGFAAPGHAHGGGRGFNVDHSELVLSGSIDPYLRGLATFAIADEEVEVEEAWFQTLALGGGFTLRGGRFLSGIGYVNEQHPHAWDFADQNLMYRALFGEHLIHDGVQLRWLAPTDLFLELGAEAARGQFFPGSAAAGDRNGAGAWAAFAKVGGDLGDSHSWRAGINYLAARPRQRPGEFEDANDVEAETALSGDSRTWIVDFVWKWAPQGNPARRHFKLQAEVFEREEEGELFCADNTAGGGACTGLSDAYRSKPSGWYAQGVFQFMPRWRAGYRYDRLDPGSAAFGANPIPHPDDKPYRHSVMLDFSPSEFSRFRVQLAQDKSMAGITDNQLVLQYIHSLGAHGAHRF